ncbi:MAG: delta-aminolevulinic acid dehydratase [Bacteroidales bacterium]|nr:delta-aminolevulinic acid dehydratase [Bacteroidales bacterium]
METEFVLHSFKKLESYCSQETWKGWDPYDGLNSKLFQAIPFVKNWDLARLAWIQAFKRNPFNLRKLLLIPKDYNPKGVGLSLTGYCNLFRLNQNSGKNILDYSSDTILAKIRQLADLLLSLQSKGYSGSCWGYNFDWQARRLFLFPKGTPTVVATTFCSAALLDAYSITKENIYLETALSSASFVLNDLKRTFTGAGFLFSYSPLEGNNTVYNASLMGSKLLSLCYSYDKKEEYLTAARGSIQACIENQNKDGSWFYGRLPVQNWIDSFHTGYNLESIVTYQNMSGDYSYSREVEKGFDFYINHFFLEDGRAKYYHNKTYPIDIHCPAQLFVTLGKMDKFGSHKDLADKVMKWAILNMQDKKGYFYYQIKPGLSSKISYMRWSNAFMFYAMTYYLLNRFKSYEKNKN